MNEVATIPMVSSVPVAQTIESMVQAAEVLGKAFAMSGMFGCGKVEQGIVLAMHCLMERKSPLEIMAEYHIVEGKMSMRSDAMLSRLSKNGGTFKWTMTGDDGKEAKLWIKYKEREDTISYTMADAIKQGIVKAGSAWQKTPGAMLRARCTSKGMRMIAPDLVAGVYVPEEIQDFNNNPDPQPSKPLLATVSPVSEPVKVVVAEVEPAPIPPRTEKHDLVSDFCQAILGYEELAKKWFVKHAWIKEGQSCTDVSEAKMKQVIDKKDSFIAKIQEKA